MPPDAPICVEVNLTRARCVKIISGETFAVDENHLLNGKDWWSQRPTMIQVPAQSWAEIKKFIIKICKKTNKCQEEISSWDRSVETIDQAIAEKPK